jgi:hypothetical protein
MFILTALLIVKFITWTSISPGITSIFIFTFFSFSPKVESVQCCQLYFECKLRCRLFYDKKTDCIWND